MLLHTNIENEIKRCLISLYKQKMRNVEFLIVDDGSTDKTSFIINSFLDEVNDPRFKYFWEKMKECL